MPGLGLFLDVVIVVLLGATIFYAIRLSRYLDAFRANRADMEYLIRELSAQITRAQSGVTALDDAARESGEELQARLTKARALIEELSIVTEAGDSLANRLETLAVRNRSIADDMGSAAASAVYPGMRPSAPLVEPPAEKYSPAKSSEPTYREAPPPPPSFFNIRDPDFDRDEPETPAPRTLGSALGGSAGAEDEFESEAERNLAAALRRRRSQADY